jgi:hypothetical protein
MSARPVAETRSAARSRRPSKTLKRPRSMDTTRPSSSDRTTGGSSAWRRSPRVMRCGLLEVVCALMTRCAKSRPSRSKSTMSPGETARRSRCSTPSTSPGSTAGVMLVPVTRKRTYPKARTTSAANSIRTSLGSRGRARGCCSPFRRRAPTSRTRARSGRRVSGKASWQDPSGLPGLPGLPAAWCAKAPAWLIVTRIVSASRRIRRPTCRCIWLAKSNS